MIVYAVGNLEAAFPRRRWFFDLSQFRKWTNGKWQISGLGQPRPHSINFLDAISRNRLRIGDMAEPVKKVSSFRVVAEDAMDAKTTESHSATTEAPRFDDVPKIRTSPEIVTRELTLYFANRLVLDRINLTISPNCVTSIIGPTGTGKSTFLRCINRTNDMLEGVRTTGEILLDGHDINAPGTDVAKLRKRVALQTYAILPTSVFENVAYGPRVAGVVSATGLRAAVQVGLQRAGLWDEVEKMLDERASRLSLGQQYRLCIARALATEPDVLLLDEPALALRSTRYRSFRRFDLRIEEATDNCDCHEQCTAGGHNFRFHSILVARSADRSRTNDRRFYKSQGSPHGRLRTWPI